MASGSITITPGYLPADGENMTNAKFRLLASPVGQIGAGQVTATELSSAINAQLAAVASAIVTVTPKSASWTVMNADKGTLFDVTTASSDVSATLPSPGSLASGWYTWFRKADTAVGRVLTIPTTTPNPTILSKQEQRMLLYTDTVNFYAFLFAGTIDASGNFNLSSNANITLIPTNLVQIGGVGATFPALKTSGTATLALRAGDDSGDASVTAKNVTATGIVRNSNDVALAASGAQTIDWSQGNSFYATLTGNITGHTFTNVNNGQTIVVAYTQDGTGSRTVSWAGPTIKWPGSAAPTQTTTANKSDVLTFKQINGVIYGNSVQNLG